MMDVKYESAWNRSVLSEIQTKNNDKIVIDDIRVCVASSSSTKRFLSVQKCHVPARIRARYFARDYYSHL